ncbi:YdcF family protein [Patescibacteria group bacterium]|nr:YdcF family protein [Patescibacteria group bacterium]
MNERLSRILLEIRVFVVWVICVAIFLIGWIILHVQTDHVTDIYTSSRDLPEKAPVALVLGASVKEDGTPSDALRDRLLIGEELYREKKVEKVLVTGDDGGFRQDEITQMKAFLIERGVKEEDILVDGQGYRTYESCRRAKQELKLEKVIVVTQRFHMARALYLCNALGLESVGVTSDLQTYQKGTYFWARDLAASVKAFWEINRDRAGEIAI